MSRIINPVRELLERSGLAEDRSLEIAKSMQANMENLRRDNDELRRRVQELELDHRPPETEFKHEAHKKLMRDIEHLLQK
jgi:protein required for attachment to host cells